jgi:hypothetical protein
MYEPTYYLVGIYINITIAILDFTHRRVLYLKSRRFGDWILSPSSGGTFSDGPGQPLSLVSTIDKYLEDRNYWTQLTRSHLKMRIESKRCILK